MAIVSLLSLALVGAMLVSFLGSEANAAAMRSAQHAGYARLVFDFDDAPTFQATVVDEQLIVRFQQSYTGPLDANALNGVSGYIVQPKLSSDKRTLTFDLKRSLTIKSFTHKRSAVIDLIEAAAPAPPAAPPAAPMQGSANQQAAKLPAPAAVDAAPSVPVRVGSHADFVRLVFDWDRTTDYDAGMDDGLARIRFARDGLSLIHI